MTGEMTVPILPCASVEDVEAFYTVLGFETTYRQLKPYACLAIRRDDLHLQFAEIAGFVPADSYGSCLVVVDDTGEMHEAFAAGMRAAYGRVLVGGIPRMTRPRRKINGTAGFTVVDPGGNWIRITPRAVADDGPDDQQPRSAMGRALDNAVVQGDSRGHDAQAAKILDTALRKDDGSDPVATAEARAYRAEIAERLGEPPNPASARMHGRLQLQPRARIPPDHLLEPDRVTC